MQYIFLILKAYWLTLFSFFGRILNSIKINLRALCYIQNFICYFSGSIAEPPGGTIFVLLILVVFALLSGWLFSLAKLPPLLGMLITGIVIKNLPGMAFDQYWTRTSR